MKRIGVLLVLMVAMVPCARADEASKRAKAEELFSVMHMDKLMSQIMDSIVGQVKQMSQSLPDGQTMSPAQQKVFDDFQSKAISLAMAQVSWKALEPDMVTLYAKTYSEEELDGIVAFYKSPVGQTMLEKTPELTTASMQLTQSRMGDLQPKMKALTEQLMKDMDAATPKN